MADYRWPVIHVQHMSRLPDSPLRPDRPSNAFKPESVPKPSTFSMVRGPVTVRMAGNLGFAVTVVDDATATFERRGPDGTRFSAGLIHGLQLAILHGEFATVRSTREVLAAAGP